jgi:hypothetical protein
MAYHSQDLPPHEQAVPGFQLLAIYPCTWSNGPWRRDQQGVLTTTTATNDLAKTRVSVW